MGSRHGAALAAVLVILLTFSSSASASTVCPTDLVLPSDALAVDTVVGVVCDVNVIRVRDGLQPLRWNWRLWAAAQGMARDIRTRHFFSHITPDGKNLADRLDGLGYLPDDPDWLLGENLGWGSGLMSSPLSIVFGWMNSEGHRRNVLEPSFEDIAVGVAQGSPTIDNPSGMVYVADFGTRGDRVSAAARMAHATRAYRRGRGWARAAGFKSRINSLPSRRQDSSS